MTNGLSASDHVRGIISDFSQTLYALRILHAHGMWHGVAGHLQIGRRRQATVCVQCLGGIYYGGRLTASRRILPPHCSMRLRLLSVRHSVVRIKTCLAHPTSLSSVKIIHNRRHLLYNRLPPPSSASQNYDLRPRIHNRRLPDYSGHLTDCN